VHRAAVQGAHHRCEDAVLGQQPDLVAAVGLAEVALVAEHDRLGQRHEGLPHAMEDGTPAAGPEVGEPLHVERAGHLDDHVQRIGQIAGASEGQTHGGQVDLRRHGLLVARIDQRDGLDEVDALQQPGEKQDVLPHSVFPDVLPRVGED
jgi:hypothetical protein